MNEVYPWLMGVVLGFPLIATLTSANAASFNPGLEDPLVAPTAHFSGDTYVGPPSGAVPNGIWHEVLPDGSTVAVWEPRDPGPCGINRPCLDFKGNGGYTRPQVENNKCSCIDWVLGYPKGPANNRVVIHPLPVFPDNPVVVSPEPPVAPVPLPIGLHLFVAALFGFGVLKWFPSSLIDRPDRA